MNPVTDNFISAKKRKLRTTRTVIFATVPNLNGRNAKNQKLNIEEKVGEIKEEVLQLSEMGIIQDEKIQEILNELETLKENVIAENSAKIYEEIEGIQKTLQSSADEGFAKFAETIKEIKEFSSKCAKKICQSGISSTSVEELNEYLKANISGTETTSACLVLNPNFARKKKR